MRKVSFAFAVLLSVAPADAGNAQRPLPSDSAVRAIIRQRVDDGRSVGIAVGLIDPDGKTRTVAYGRGAGGGAIDEHTVFEIGSITKTFTTAVLADMVARGTVRLDEPVAALLPAGSKVPSRNGRQITLLDLATQSSGLPRMPNNFTPKDTANPYVDYDGTRLLAFLSQYELPRDPGTKFDYSNLGMGLLGYALAVKAGVSYERLVTDRVLRPLGMTESAMTLTPAMRARLTPGHYDDGKPAANWDFDALAGAGALRSTIHDMLRYTAANIDPHASPIGAVLESTHAKRFQTETPNMSLGLAWLRIVNDRGDTILTHDGGTGGYRSMLAFDPRRRVGVIVLSNSASDVQDIALHLIDERIPLATKATARAEIALTPDALQRFVGVYQLAPALALSITRSNDHLVMQPTGQGVFTLYAEAPTKFFLKTLDAQVAFESDASGAVTGLMLTQSGVQMRAVRTSATPLAPVVPVPRLRPRATAADSLRALDSAWARAYAIRDTALAGAIFASDLVVTDVAGKTHGRTAELGDVAAPGIQMEYFRTEAVDARADAPPATVTGVASWRFVLNGQTTTLRRRYTATYVRGGWFGWKMVTLQLRAEPEDMTMIPKSVTYFAGRASCG